MDKKQETRERITKFFDRVQSLSKGERTALKRALGKSTNDAPASAYAAFCHALGKSIRKSESEEPWFLCACAFCAMERLMEPIYAPERPEEPMKPKAQEFVHSLCILDRKNETENMEHRLKQLVATPMKTAPAYFAEKLARPLRYLKSEGVLIDFEELLYDLRGWDTRSGWVQKKWLRTFYLNDPEWDESEEMTSDEEDTNDVD